MLSVKQLIRLTEAEDPKHRAGRLLDDENPEHELFSGKYVKLGARLLSQPYIKSSRPRSPTGAQTFHFSHRFISKTNSHDSHKPAGHPERTYLFTRRRDVAEVRDAGGRYDRKAQLWWVARSNPRAKEFASRMRGAEAERNWTRRRTGQGKAMRSTPPEFQRYIERAAASEGGKLVELEHDSAGRPISFGNIGDDVSERAAFWTAAEKRERADGRVQCRMILELPHELTADERRAVAAAVIEPLARRGLPYHAVAHLPETSKGSDPRNFHLHIVYHDRPARRTAPFQWHFAEQKDREARGAAWIEHLRRHASEVMNRALDGSSKAPIDKRYDPRTYEEMGIDKIPTRHLGPDRTQLERAGRPTVMGLHNGEIEKLWAASDHLHRKSQACDRLVKAVSAVASDDRLARQNAPLLDQAEKSLDAWTPDVPMPGGWAERRRDWAAGIVAQPGASQMRHERRHRQALEIAREADAVLRRLRAEDGSAGQSERDSERAFLETVTRLERVLDPPHYRILKRKPPAPSRRPGRKGRGL